MDERGFQSMTAVGMVSRTTKDILNLTWSYRESGDLISLGREMPDGAVRRISWRSMLHRG
jgi:hypothetical protein